MKKRIIAADIGGTTSRFAYFLMPSPAQLELVSVVRLPTTSFPSFSGLLEAVSAETQSIRLSEADVTVIAVAGPVSEGRYSDPPNIPWDIDLDAVRPKFGMERCVLINDFLAQAFSAVSPLAAQALPVLSGIADASGAIAVIGPGTGLGKALLVPAAGRFIGAPSEGGHGNFCPENEHELNYARFVAERQGAGYATWDDVVSGRGLSYLHAFLCGETLSPEQAAGRFNYESEVLRWFARFCGRVCRNYALDTLATGGVVVVGGVAAKNPSIVQHPEFAASFRASLVHSDLLSRIPVVLIQNEDSGLWGAAYYGNQVDAQ